MAMIPEYEPHPFTSIVARVPTSDDEYKLLEDSLIRLGMINPIVLYQDKILAGLTRYSIAKDRGDIGNVQFTEFNGNEDQALQLVIDENMARRHLNESERGMAAARLVRVKPKHTKNLENEAWAGEIFKVGISTVKRALELFVTKREDLIDAVDKRVLRLTNAAPLTKIPPQTVQKILESDNPNLSAAKVVKETNRQTRQMEMARVAVKEARESVDQSKRYGVIYADPPWSFETYSENGKGKSADNHYPTMPLEDIKNIPMPAASNCALFLWTTVAHLENAIDVLNAWGFDYKSAYGWHKTDIGTGYWSRNNLELLLLGTMGDVPAPTPDQISEQCLTVKQGRHSEKPEVFADMITKMFPDVPKLEMFARATSHKGEHWSYWGNEVGVEITPKKNGKKKNGKAVSGNGEHQPEQQRNLDTEDSNSGSSTMESTVLS